MSLPRRDFLKATGGAVGFGWMRGVHAASGDPWEQATAIRARIRPPVFPKRDFEITRYGAVGDGAKDCTEAIARAIAECSQAGGGRVVAPPGVWLTGAIHLRSNVELHVPTGATLRFSHDPSRYLPIVYTRWEGIECLNYSAFIYSDGQDNIAITGAGTLDGQADCQRWWMWKGRTDCGWIKGQPSQDAARNALVEMGEKDTPLKQRKFGEGYYLRPNFIQPIRGRNILIEGIAIVNSPMWEINPLMCTNVIVRDVKITSHGPNNDGCDPDSCTDVLIENCVFDTGDDCIAIKSGRNRDGRRVAIPTENVVIRNCRMKDGHGGVTIGSEMSGGVRNVYAEDCVLDSPSLNQALRLKTNAMRGGTIENVFFRNLTIGEVADAVLQVDFFYEEGPNGPERPVVRNIDIRDVTCKKAKFAWYLRGFRNAPVRDIRLEHCNFDHITSPNVVENVEGLKLAAVMINGKRADA